MTSDYQIEKAAGGGFERREDVSAMTRVAESRAAQEVQAALVIAKRFPRDQFAAVERITKAFSRVRLAEEGLYSYVKGERIEDLSIRAAEALAQAWGNMTFGSVEVAQRDGESDMEAFCWDLETNVRVVKHFVVKHERHTKRGITKLSDPRDLYETTANQASRRVRACILASIPGDVVAIARETLYKTLAGDTSEPREDRIRKMAAAFEQTHAVSTKMLEDYLGHALSATTDHELVRLRGVYQSIRDGIGDVATYFTPRRVSPTAVGSKPTSAIEAAAKLAAEIDGDAEASDPEPSPSVDAAPADDEALARELDEQAAKDDWFGKDGE